MGYLPVMLDLTDRRVLVVGGGLVAGRKVSRLLESGARVRVVATLVVESLESLAAGEPRIDLHRRAYRDDDLDGTCLAFSATGVPEVERAVAAAAARRGIWCNAADDPDNCSFIVPAVLERGPLQVAVSTGGASPALAVRARDAIASMLGAEYGAAAERLGALRRSLPAGPSRSAAFVRMLDGGLLDALRLGDAARVERLTMQARCDATGGPATSADLEGPETGRGGAS